MTKGSVSFPLRDKIPAKESRAEAIAKICGICGNQNSDEGKEKSVGILSGLIRKFIL